MKKLILAVALLPLLAVGGCQTVASVAGFTITQSDVDTARTAYDGAFLTPATHYRQLGYCATGPSATLLKPCADRTIVAQLQNADKLVRTDFNNVQQMVTSGSNTGLSAAWITLQDAISTAKGLALNLGVK